MSGGLSQYDQNPDATPQARAARNAARGGSKLPESELQLNYGTTEDRAAFAERWGGYPNPCWCGGELCETRPTRWLGSALGLPHPTDKEDLALRLERALEEDWNDHNTGTST